VSTNDKRLDALEKDVAVMKQDIIYKLDDTNSAVTMIKGGVGTQGSAEGICRPISSSRPT
jgi:hypothetical protein